MEKKKIELIVIDFDGTACHFPYGKYGSSWDGFASVCGVYDKLSEVLSDYYNHPNKEEIEEEMTKKAAKYFKGVSVGYVDKLRPFPYSEGFVDFVSSVIIDNMKIGFLSSGINIIVDKAAQELGLDFSISTKLEVKDKVLTGEVKEIVPLWKKEEVFLDLLSKYDVLPKEVCYIGDHENDITCLKSAEVGVAYDPKTSKVEEAADFVINDFKELNEILNLN